MIKEEYFWPKVYKTKTCWIWCGVTAKHNGYGRFSYRVDGKVIHHPAHRYSLMCIGVEIPKGMVVDHKCRIRTCVNPDHLRVVTKKINATENSLGPSAINKVKTHCPKGHEYDKRNTSIDTDKKGTVRRRCKTCRALHSAGSVKSGYNKRYYAENKIKWKAYNE